MSDEAWLREYVAWKACESLALHRALALILDASMRLLAEPFSPACRARMRAQVDAARRDLEQLKEIPAPHAAEVPTPPVPEPRTMP